jgi:hypothetical protein
LLVALAVLLQTGVAVAAVLAATALILELLVAVETQKMLSL